MLVGSFNIHIAMNLPRLSEHTSTVSAINNELNTTRNIYIAVGRCNTAYYIYTYAGRQAGRQAGTHARTHARTHAQYNDRQTESITTRAGKEKLGAAWKERAVR